MPNWLIISGRSWDWGEAAMVEKHNHWGGEPGALVSADQPELRSVWAPRVARPA